VKIIEIKFNSVEKKWFSIVLLSSYLEKFLIILKCHLKKTRHFHDQMAAEAEAKFKAGLKKLTYNLNSFNLNSRAFYFLASTIPAS
jgi:hypothetical protein